MAKRSALVETLLTVESPLRLHRHQLAVVLGSSISEGVICVFIAIVPTPDLRSSAHR